MEINSSKKRDVKYGLFLGLYLIIFISLIAFAHSITDGCGDEVEKSTACVVRTPPITCSTVDIYNASNQIINDDLSMEEIVTGTGVYNFTFNANGTGIHTIVLCDNTSTQINVETTDETDLGTILSNQVTLQDDIQSVNDTIKNRTKIINTSIIANLSNDNSFFRPFFKSINDSIILNLSNDLGFFDPLFSTLNDSILSNFSSSSISTSVSSSDQISIGRQCAVQTLGANFTINYHYNKTSFFVVNISYNYSALDIKLNETFAYDNESFLTNVTRVTT